MRWTAFSGTIVSASTKHSTRPELAAVPTLRAAAQLRPKQRTRRTPTSSAKMPTIAAVASSLPSSTTITSKPVSGSRRSSRERPDASATLARMASRTSAINASSFRAGITNERRRSVIALQGQPRYHQRAAREQLPLPPRTDPQPGRRHIPFERPGGIEAPSVHRESRVRRNVADESRDVKRHDRPQKLPGAMPRVTEAARIQRLHDDNWSASDASGFLQDTGRVVRVGEHEE